MEKLQRLARSLRTARAAELPSDPKEAIFVLIPMIMQNQHRAVGELLVSSDLDINQRFGKANRTLIHIASNIGAYECLLLLLKRGADVNCQDRSGVTPLQLAARNGHPKCIQKLVENKASLEAKNNEGMTAVHWLASNGRTELLSDLLPFIRNIDVEDFNGQTALHVACLNGHKSTVTKLLDSKANIEKKDTRGCTPLYFASSHGHAKLVQELLRRGASLQSSFEISPLEVSFKNGYEEVCGVMVEHDPSLVNTLLQLSQYDSVDEPKVLKVLRHVCSVGPLCHRTILIGLAEMARTSGLELLSISSDYQSTVNNFLRTINILSALGKIKPSELQVRVRSDSNTSLRSRLDSTSSRILKSFGGTGSGSPPLLDSFDDDLPLEEVSGALEDLWRAMENWFDLIGQDMKYVPESVVDEQSKHHDTEGQRDVEVKKLSAKDIATALLRKKPKGIKRRSLASLDSLRLSQPALEFNLGIYNSNLAGLSDYSSMNLPGNEYMRSISADLNLARDMYPTNASSLPSPQRLYGLEPPMHTMTLNRNLPSMQNPHLRLLNNERQSAQAANDSVDGCTPANSSLGLSTSGSSAGGKQRLKETSTRVENGEPGPSSSRSRAEASIESHEKPEVAAEPERCFSPTDSVVEATADRLCGMVHGHYISYSSKFYWESKEHFTEFQEFIERHCEVLELLVARKPKVIFEHFHFLIDNPLLLQKFLSVIHAQKFSERREWFYENLHRGKEEMSPQEYEKSTITVIRDTLLQSSCEQILHGDARKLKQGVNVQFDGEAGLGEGVLREWLDLLLKELLNPDFALFTLSADGATFQPNSNSCVNPDHLNYFRFAGQIMGLALYNKQLVNAYFTRSFYKHILGVPVSYSDVASIDPEYAKSLQWILDHDINDLGLDLNFSVETDVFGQVREVDLKPYGKDITVTDENKNEYVQLAADLRMTKAIKPQIYSFLDGFHQFVPHSLVALFDEYELEIMLSGIPEIDLDDWRKHTSYSSGYTEDSQVIKWFWEVVETFHQKQRVKLLQFATGSSRVPWGGFSNLSGAAGKQNFTISAGGKETQLPTASTCFNLLKLPDYSSKEELKTRLMVALDCGHLGFEFA